MAIQEITNNKRTKVYGRAEHKQIMTTVSSVINSVADRYQEFKKMPIVLDNTYAQRAKQILLDETFIQKDSKSFSTLSQMEEKIKSVLADYKAGNLKKISKNNIITLLNTHNEIVATKTQLAEIDNYRKHFINSQNNSNEMNSEDLNKINLFAEVGEGLSYRKRETNDNLLYTNIDTSLKTEEDLIEVENDISNAFKIIEEAFKHIYRIVDMKEGQSSNNENYRVGFFVSTGTFSTGGVVKEKEDRCEFNFDYNSKNVRECIKYAIHESKEILLRKEYFEEMLLSIDSEIFLADESTGFDLKIKSLYENAIKEADKKLKEIQDLIKKLEKKLEEVKEYEAKKETDKTNHIEEEQTDGPMM